METKLIEVITEKEMNTIYGGANNNSRRYVWNKETQEWELVIERRK
jgi:bacteriocin-like protein